MSKSDSGTLICIATRSVSFEVTLILNLLAKGPADFLAQTIGLGALLDGP